MTAPIDLVDGGIWRATFRFEPFLGKWFLVVPDAAGDVLLLDDRDVPEVVREARASRPGSSRIKGAYSAPLKLQIQLNRNCNHQCAMCYANSYRGRMDASALTLPELDRLFADVKRWGVCRVNFVGGEVFMRKDFAAVVECAIRHRLLSSCITNARIPGTCLERHGSVLGRLFHVQVSCNGVGRSYEEEYGVDDWPEAKKCIAAVVRASRSTTLSYVINPGNVDHIPAFLEFAASVAPTVVKFGSVCWSGRSSRTRGMQYYRKTLPLAKTHIVEGRRRHPGLRIQSQLDLGTETPLWEDFAHGYRPFEFYFAPEGRDGLYLSSEGDVFPFPLLSDRPEFRLGNVRADDLRHIWRNHPTLEELRAVSFANSACGKAGCTRVCGLWSRSYAYAWSGRLDGKVPCEITG